MTRQQTWSARSPRHRLRRRRVLVRWLLTGALVAGGGVTVLAVATSPDGTPSTPDAPNASATPSPTTERSSAAPTSPPVAAPSPTDAVVPMRPGAQTRVPTPEDPLRVWISGDSMWELAGPALADLAESTGVATVEVDVRYSSGLTRPDFFDWSAQVDEVLRRERPEVVVVLMGANDSQPLVEGDAVHDPGTPGFAEAYGARVEALMSRLADGDRQVVWVGLPVMRPTGYDVRIADLTRIQQAAADHTPGVVFVPTRALFADQDGRYVDALPDEEGVVRVLRGTDGIHLSPDGAARLAEHVLPHLPPLTGPHEEPVP